MTAELCLKWEIWSTYTSGFIQPLGYTVARNELKWSEHFLGINFDAMQWSSSLTELDLNLSSATQT